jgi:5'-3' exonuclease
MVKPKELVYIAIDGVAPRAKLNQQRARRYRGGSEEMEQSVYESFYDSQEKDTQIGDRLSGKFESSDEEGNDEQGGFHSNVITPGTQFFSECTEHLQHWIQYKLSTDPKWKDLKIIFSGPNTPGEGEHKIMEFMRQERAKPDYNPNLRHAIMGQDADLILLGLATHEPNLCIFRERVVFNMQMRNMLQGMGS